MKKKIVGFGLFILLNAQTVLLFGVHNNLQNLGNRKKVGYYAGLPIEEVDFKKNVRFAGTIGSLAKRRKDKKSVAQREEFSDDECDCFSMDHVKKITTVVISLAYAITCIDASIGAYIEFQRSNTGT